MKVVIDDAKDVTILVSISSSRDSIFAMSVTLPTTTEDPLVYVLYRLLRDELPAGVLEKIVQNLETSTATGFSYSNQGLASYAAELADRIRRWRPRNVCQRCGQEFVYCDCLG